MGLDLFAPMSSTENHAQAHRYANVAWGWAIAGAACYYFWGWAATAVPALFALWAGWRSIKATSRALKWEKVEEIRARASSSEGGS